MESGIVRLFKVGFNITNSWNHRLDITKNKFVSSVLHALLHDKFLHQEKKICYISIPKISIYLFKYF